MTEFATVPCCCDPCPNCLPDCDEIPSAITLTLSGFANDVDCGCGAWNGAYLLDTYDGSFGTSPSIYCQWTGTFEISVCDPPTPNEIGVTVALYCDGNISIDISIDGSFGASITGSMSPMECPLDLTLNGPTNFSVLNCSGTDLNAAVATITS